MRQVWSRAALVAMLAVCGAALRWGGPLKRRVAVLVAAGWIATLAAQRLMGEVAPVPVLAAIDAAAFALFVVFSWGDRSGWTVFAVACQGLALGVHAIRLLSPAMSTWTYLTALAAAGYGVLAALAWGVWTHRRSLSS